MENAIINFNYKGTSGRWMVETNQEDVIEASAPYIDYELDNGYLSEDGNLFTGTFVEGFEIEKIIELDRKVS